MYKGKRIGASIPCFNEEDFIGKTIEGLPAFVDRIYIIDDCSKDNTVAVIKQLMRKNKKIVLLQNKKNMGNGYSVVQGYKAAIKDKLDIVCILAGDNQCRSEYLHELVEEVVNGNCDYAKANRFFHPIELRQMPIFRKLGNIIMSVLSKFASGYYSISDPLNSYSALDMKMLRKMDVDSISHRYDFENSLLFHLYLAQARIKDVPIPARYEGEISDINLLTYIPTTSKTIASTFIKRIYYKYVLFTFHPIALFLTFGFILMLFGIGYGIRIVVEALRGYTSTTATVMLSVVPFITGFQLILNAFVLDIQNEPK